MIQGVQTWARHLAPAVLLLGGFACVVACGQAAPATQPAATQPAAQPFEDSLQTEQGRQRLIELIKQQAIEYQASNPPAAGPAVLQERPALPPVQAPRPPQTPPSATAPATQGAPGCGPATTGGLDLTPPPPDQPQPKAVVKQTTVVNEEVWSGQQATFEFEVANEGQGPLAIRLRGG